jgi:hypothetical protein
VLRFADLSRDEDLLVQAQRRARAIVDVDPQLDRESTLRSLLEARFEDRLRLFGVG